MSFDFIDIPVIQGELMFTLHSFHQWVNSQGQFPLKRESGEQWLWVDSLGNVLTQGEDFMAARDMETFPVKVYFLKRVIHKKRELQS